MIVIKIDGPSQSGKTRSAIGIIKQMTADGVPCLWVAPTEESARWARDTFDLRCRNVGAYAFLRIAEHVDFLGFRVIVFDDLDRLPNQVVGRMIREAKHHLVQVNGPSQLIAINSGGVCDAE